MKRIALIAVMLLTAGLCLAQSDSAAPAADTTKTKIQIDQTTGDSTTVTVTTEKGQTDSATTVTIRHGARQDRRPQWRRNWVVGLKTYSIANLPGSIFLQRVVGRKLFIGCGFDYTRNPGNIYIPNIGNMNGSNGDAYTHQTNSYSAWSWQLTPECLTPLFTMRNNRLLTGVSASLSYGEARGSSDYRYASPYDTSMASITGKGKYNSYSIAIPMIVEHRFTVRKRVFFVGLQSALVSLDYTKQTSESDEYRRYDSYPVNHYHYVNSWTNPLHLTFRNPFQNNVSLVIKWYI